MNRQRIRGYLSAFEGTGTRTDMTTLPTTADLPESLHEYDQWICWREQARGSKPTKVPVDPQNGQYASATDSATWTSFEEARLYADGESVDGLGFVFTDGDPFVGVDLDDARDSEKETPTEWAEEIIDDLDSYTEVSPSGTGYHVLVEGELPPGRNRRGSVEIYETARFFTMTGERVHGTRGGIEARSEELRGVYASHLADEHDDESDSEPAAVEIAKFYEDGETESNEESDSGLGSDLSDEDLLERARSAANGAKFERLWRGDTHGYDSHSEADMALACLLAFWTGGNTTQMDRLFRQSGLMREKFDAVHYANGRTYGEVTLARARNVTNEHFSPKTGRAKESGDSTDAQSESEPESIEVEADPTEKAQTPDVTIEPDSLTERERARIETITSLERQLRDVERERDRLQDERNRARHRLEAVARGQRQTGPKRGFLGRLSQRLFN
ncbi:hypothetical protein M0R88_10635 [Halorussus gelatinilyticus]|uniref:NrS-1 polymerase-like HBD domain-containing protein n=1 Tax=Halorussus gelatinilyticus TaxID=2937524 RepID=A0A8U0IDY8_9EURY|nr:hypothetical protein [Halorussus gelatinilyticus]UPV98984.1 hypothetical protein M0R88_10635 [Halorussus gelatinilyticus]